MSVHKPTKLSSYTYLLFGVSAKHFSEEVSTTVSQNETTGSATLMSGKQNHSIMNLDVGHQPFVTIFDEHGPA